MRPGAFLLRLASADQGRLFLFYDAVARLAASADGFIARPDGNQSRLEKRERHGCLHARLLARQYQRFRALYPAIRPFS